jgi:hypothetical protein
MGYTSKVKYADMVLMVKSRERYCEPNKPTVHVFVYAKVIASLASTGPIRLKAIRL